MATTINSYSIGLTLNASDYINKSQLSAQETRKLSRAIEAARSPAEKFSREQEFLTKSLEKGGIQQGIYNRLLDAARQKHLAAGLATHKNAMGNQSLTRQLGGVRTEIGSLRTNPAFLATAAGIASITAAVTGAVVAMRSAHKEIDEQAKAAKKLDLTFNQLQGLQFAGGEIAGASGDQVVNAIKQMQIRISKAVDGDKAIEKAFGKLGLRAGDLMAAGPVESIKKIAKGMDGLTTQAEKLNVTAELFGRGGTEIVALLTSGSDVLAESIEFQQKWNGLSEAQVRSVERANDAWKRVWTVTDGITKQLSVEMAPVVESMANDALALSKSMGDVRSMSTTTGGSMAASWGLAKDAIQLSTLTARAGIKAMQGDLAGLGDTLRAAIDISGVFKASKAFIDAKTGIAKLDTPKLPDTAAAVEGAAKITEEFDKQRAALENQYAAVVFGEQAARRLRLEAEGWADELITSLETWDGMIERAKTALETQKKITDEAKRTSEALTKTFDTDVAASLKGAQAFFDAEVKKIETMRKAIEKGPESMEVGSAAAARFMADQINMSIGAGIPDKPTVGEAQMLTEAGKQLAELQAGRAAQERLADSFQKFLAGPDLKGIEIPPAVLARMNGTDQPADKPIDKINAGERAAADMQRVSDAMPKPVTMPPVPQVETKLPTFANADQLVLDLEPLRALGRQLASLEQALRQFQTIKELDSRPSIERGSQTVPSDEPRTPSFTAADQLVLDLEPLRGLERQMASLEQYLRESQAVEKISRQTGTPPPQPTQMGEVSQQGNSPIVQTSPDWEPLRALEKQFATLEQYLRETQAGKSMDTRPAVERAAQATGAATMFDTGAFTATIDQGINAATQALTNAVSTFIQPEPRERPDFDANATERNEVISQAAEKQIATMKELDRNDDTRLRKLIVAIEENKIKRIR